MASLKRVVSEESPFEYAPTENQYHVDGVRVTVVLNARPQLSSLLPAQLYGPDRLGADTTDTTLSPLV